MTISQKRRARLLGLSVVSSTSLSVAAAMLMPQPAFSQNAAPEPAPKETQLGVVKVQSEAIDPNPNAVPGVPYKARTSGDERRTRPLAETPATISVLTKAMIDDSGETDLSQILDAQPGITVGTGENGNAFGDRYVIRGQEAKSDVFVDGLRDPGMTVRESFAIEQLEISKGPNSSFAGRGTTGGAINAITKTATLDYDFANASAGIGTDNYTRWTLDANHAFDETLAVRVNGLYAKEDVPGRSPAYRNRQGVAVSGLYNPNENLQIFLDYYGLYAKDNPDVGPYLTGAGLDRRPMAPIPPVQAQEQDFLTSAVNTGTARIKYQINPNLRFTNILRVASANNGYVLSGTNGATTNASNPGGVYQTSTISTHQGWQEVDYTANQANLFWDADIGGMKHEFILSAEYSDHKVRNGVFSVVNSGQNCRTGAATTNNAFCSTGPNFVPVANLRTLLNRNITRGNWDIDWRVKTTGISVMDTVDLTDRLTAFAGLRADWFDYTLVTQNTTTLAQVRYPYSDTLFNGHAGLVYKIMPDVNVYASVSSSEDINGGESDVGTSSGYGGAVIFAGSIAGAKPERSLNYEIGSKWNLFNDRLLATVALFRSTKSDVMEGADYLAFGTFNTGENRVQGIEFGVTGMISDDFTLSAGLAMLDSEVLASATPANIGKQLGNFAKTSATIQGKLRVTEELSVGAAYKYESKRYGGQPDTAAPFNAVTGIYNQPVPSYGVFDLFLTYQVNDNLNARLNVNNVTDEEYYTAAYRGGFFLYKGDARQVKFSLDYAL